MLWMNWAAEPETGTTSQRLDPISELPQVLYIMGTGRSGTTVLEILLANNPQVVGVGEATHVFRDGFIDNVDCSCGQPTRNCPAWSAIAMRCGWDDKVVGEQANLFHHIAWHSRFPLLAASLVPGATLKRYKDVNACMFGAAAAFTSASVVVDSSKYAGRALALARLFPDKVRVICLTRSPASLVAAFEGADSGEQKPKSLPAVFLYYLYTLASFRVVAWNLGSRLLKISYEDIMAFPVETLERIEQWSGQDMGQAISAIDDDSWLEVGHMVTGNRLRKQGKIKFKPRMPINCQSGVVKNSIIWLMNLYRKLLGF
jgi:hypothetical protein